MNLWPPSGSQWERFFVPPVGNTVVISGGGKDKRRSTDLGSLRIWRDVVEFRALT